MCLMNICEIKLSQNSPEWWQGENKKEHPPLNMKQRPLEDGGLGAMSEGVVDNSLKNK